VFDEKSRYRDLPVLTHLALDGTERRYVARRLLPDPAALRPLTRVRITDSERLDLIAHRTLSEPTAFWRIADANAAMHPDDLLTPAGRLLIVPSPL
jgi:hypothetical protein